MRMRKIIFMMEMKCLVGFFIAILALTPGCIDSGNLPGMGPKEVSVDLSTPEGVMEAYWKYLDVGEYDKAYDLVCDDEYFTQIKGSGISKLYDRQEFIANAKEAYGEKGEKLDTGSPQITGKYPLTGRGASEYGVGDIVEEGYDVGCKAGKLTLHGANIGGGGKVVRYNGRWCIAKGVNI